MIYQVFSSFFLDTPYRHKSRGERGDERSAHGNRAEGVEILSKLSGFKSTSN
jgi:hypothetical protein